MKTAMRKGVEDAHAREIEFAKIDWDVAAVEVEEVTSDKTLDNDASMAESYGDTNVEARTDDVEESAAKKPTASAVAGDEIAEQSRAEEQLAAVEEEAEATRIFAE